MLRTTLAKAFIKRTIRPLYGWEQATPVDCILDAAWAKTVDIYPGMALMRKATSTSGAGEVVTLIDNVGVVFGLSGLYIAPVYGIDEVADSGVSSLPVWVLGPDAEFEILDPAFDSTVPWTFPVDGTDLLVFAYTAAAGVKQGKLAPAGAANITAKPVARAVSRPDTNRLIIRGLSLSSAY
jgi:hypothetical protein